ncbi:MAG: hypothetical protein PHQ12_14640 [Chthoniobacteraceae bacterium]|nr:hypothetical protein [Chthoniobacteraceae bacterium]
MLLALFASTASAGPFTPKPIEPEVQPIIVTVQTPAGDVLAVFWGEASIGYCGGDPVNHSDPTGTTLIIDGETVNEAYFHFDSLPWTDEEKQLILDMINAQATYYPTLFTLAGACAG